MTMNENKVMELHVANKSDSHEVQTIVFHVFINPNWYICVTCSEKVMSKLNDNHSRVVVPGNVSVRYQVDRREESTAFLSSSSGETLPTWATHSYTGNMKDTPEKEAARLIQRLRELQEWQSETEMKILAEQERERSRSMRKTVALLDNNDTEDDTVSSMEYDNDHHEISTSVPTKLVNIKLYFIIAIISRGYQL